MGDAKGVVAELPQLFRLAKQLVGNNKVVPEYLKTEGDIVAAMGTGMELGMGPFTALRSVKMVKGNVVLTADSQLGLIIKAGIKFKWLKMGQDGVATISMTRPGFEPFEHSYSLKEAKQAGLAHRAVWQAHPAAMLRARCVSGAAKAYAPDVLSGVYSPEEAEEIAGEPLPAAGLFREPGSDLDRGLVTEESCMGTPILGEEETQRSEQQAKVKNESDALADEWLNMIKELMDESAMSRWCVCNGWEYTNNMHTNARSRIWRALGKHAKSINQTTCSQLTQSYVT